MHQYIFIRINSLKLPAKPLKLKLFLIKVIHSAKKNTDLCFVKLLEVVKDPHLDLEPLPDKSHLVSPVLGCQVFLSLLLILGAAPVEVDLVLVALLPPCHGALHWGLLNWLGHWHHGLPVIDWSLVRLPHLHLDQGAFLKKEEIKSQSF